MAHPPFPCFAWRSGGSVDGKKLLQVFLEQRPNAQWVLVGEGCAQSELQLWTAWNCASRRWIRSTALARSMDAEFLRYLCGTHHVSEAFKRAGVREGDTAGFLIFLPDATADEEQSDCHVSEYDSQAIESMAFAWMGFNRINNQAMKVQLRNGKCNKGLLGSITQARP